MILRCHFDVSFKKSPFLCILHKGCCVPLTPWLDILHKTQRPKSLKPCSGQLKSVKCYQNGTVIWTAKSVGTLIYLVRVDLISWYQQFFVQIAQRHLYSTYPPGCHFGRKNRSQCYTQQWFHYPIKRHLRWNLWPVSSIIIGCQKHGCWYTAWCQRLRPVTWCWVPAWPCPLLAPATSMAWPQHGADSIALNLIALNLIALNLIALNRIARDLVAYNRIAYDLVVHNSIARDLVAHNSLGAKLNSAQFNWTQFNSMWLNSVQFNWTQDNCSQDNCVQSNCSQDNGCQALGPKGPLAVSYR